MFVSRAIYMNRVASNSGSGRIHIGPDLDPIFYDRDLDLDSDPIGTTNMVLELSLIEGSRIWTQTQI